MQRRQSHHLFFFQAEDGIRDGRVTGVQTCALPIFLSVARGLTHRAPTTAGNPWTVAALKRYLTNPRIAGHSTLNGDTVGIGTWDPILTDEVFQQLQSAITVKRGTTGPKPRVALLVGLVHCAECGTVMVTGRGNKPRTGDGRRQI